MLAHFGRRTPGWRKMAVFALAVPALVAAGQAGPANAGSDHKVPSFKQVNLASDLPGVAPMTDPDVKNPWGIAFGPQTPLWVNNQASNVITLYSGANGVEPFTKVTAVRVAASSPFGIVFNPTDRFVITQNGLTQPARFIFNEAMFPQAGPPTALLTAWTNAGTPLPATTVTKATKPAALQFGLALVPGAKGHIGPRLLAADGINGVIDVYDSHFQKVPSAGLFEDPHAASIAAPYNVMFLHRRVYVTYADPEQQLTPAVSVFKRDGTFIRRLVTGGPLAGPWGMAIAPGGWGKFSHRLLVGNVDDGRINVFNRHTGKFLGALSDAHGMPLANPGLWGIAFGNGIIGTPHDLIFAAGIGEDSAGEGFYEHGLIGMISAMGRD